MIQLYLDNNVQISNENFEKLCNFSQLLKDYNDKFNLTAITQELDIHIKHFYDSLRGEKYFKKNASAIEIGSGGGFPSVPILIAREDINFTLVEATGKKCMFLQEVVNTFKLNATVCNVRAEDLAKNKNYREKFDVCCARAVAKMNTLCEYCLPFVKKGGVFIAYKTEAKEEIEQSKRALEILGGKILSVEKYELPQNAGERTLIVVEKIAQTPENYPRGRGKERTNPL